MIEVRSLTCGYGGRPVVEDVSFVVEPGETLVMLGPNGVGKTTLFKTLLDLIPRISGEILMDGVPVSSNRGRTRSAGRSAGARRSGASRPSGIAYVPQTHSPAFPFTVGEIVLMGRTPHVGLFSTPSEEDKRAVMRILDEMGMRDISDRSYTEISGGQRQMVLIARALVQDPSVLIMDEPASSLDLGNQSRLLTEIRELTRTRGLQVLMTTHNPNHALLVADKVLLIAQDTYWCGPCSEVLTEGRLSHAYGTDISIIEQELDGEPVRSCILRLNSERRFGK